MVLSRPLQCPVRGYALPQAPTHQNNGSNGIPIVDVIASAAQAIWAIGLPKSKASGFNKKAVMSEFHVGSTSVI